MTESVSYLGRVPAFGDYKKIDDISSLFNGVTTTFTVTSSSEYLNITSDKQCLISLNGVIQEPGIDFFVGSSANILVFSTAPTTGSEFFGIVAGDRLDMLTVSDGVVTNAKLADGAVTSTKIVDGSVSLNKLSSNSVNDSKIVNGSVSNTKIADSAITLQKISDNAVIESKIASGAVTNTKIADSAVTFAKLNSTDIATETDIISGTANKIVQASVSKNLLPKVEFQEVSTVITATSVIPADNTMPQITEGTQVATITVTPRTTTEKFIITYNATYSVGSGMFATFAMFVNGGTNAVQCFTDIGRNAAGSQNLCMKYIYTPGSLSPQTITVRAGPNGGGGSIWINGDAGGVLLFGGGRGKNYNTPGVGENGSSYGSGGGGGQCGPGVATTGGNGAKGVLMIRYKKNGGV